MLQTFLKLIIKLIDTISGDGKGFWCWAVLYPEEKPKAKHLRDNAYLVNGIECRRCWIPKEGLFEKPVSGKKDMAYMSKSICKKICNNKTQYSICWGYPWENKTAPKKGGTD